MGEKLTSVTQTSLDDDLRGLTRSQSPSHAGGESSLSHEMNLLHDLTAIQSVIWILTPYIVHFAPPLPVGARRDQSLEQTG